MRAGRERQRGLRLSLPEMHVLRIGRNRPIERRQVRVDQQMMMACVGALDTGRWHLTAPVPPIVRALALAAMAAGLTMFYRAMRENQFFSAVVRIQDDRGHRVVDTGPYSIVRHPGYAGLLVVPPVSGLALGSWLAVAVGAIMSALVVRRVLFEDAFLRQHLTGYGAYAERVPHRLIPRVW